MFSTLVNVFFVLMVVAGILQIKSINKSGLKYKKANYFKIKFWSKEKNSITKKEENVLVGSGYFLNRDKYVAFLFTISCTLMVLGVIFYSKTIIFFCILFLSILFPFKKIIAYESPFQIILSWLVKRYKEKKDFEIYKGMSIVKNLAIIRKDKPVGADYYIEMLALMDGVMQVHYLKMLSQVRINKREDALNDFVKDVGTNISADFGRLLLKIDELNPIELLETILLSQKSIREEHITKEKKKDEIISDFLYFPVLINVLLVFINMMVITYFAEQKNMLTMFI